MGMHSPVIVEAWTNWETEPPKLLFSNFKCLGKPNLIMKSLSFYPWSKLVAHLWSFPKSCTSAYEIAGPFWGIRHDQRMIPQVLVRMDYVPESTLVGAAGGSSWHCLGACLVEFDHLMILTINPPFPLCFIRILHHGKRPCFLISPLHWTKPDIYMWGFPQMGASQNGWFIRENPNLK